MFQARAMMFRCTHRYTMAAGSLLLLAIVSPAKADSLGEALLNAYRTNPTLNAARSNQRATDENVPIQRAQGLPSVSVMATHIEFIRQSANAFLPPERNLGVNSQLLVPVYSGGAVRNGIAAAKVRVEAGQAELRSTESGLFSQVVAAYMDVIRTEALVALAINNVAVLRTNLEATSDRFQIGDLTITDVAQSRSRLAVAQSDLETAEANLIAAREAYIEVVGVYPEELEAPPPLPRMPESANAAVAIALQRNPDLIAARERARAAGHETEVAGSGRLPTVSVFVNGDYSDFFGTLRSQVEGTVQREFTTNAGVRATIPLFQGGLPAARQRQANARESAALEDVVAAERQLIAETRSTYAEWQAANSVIESAQIAVEAAELGLEGVRAENTIGNRQILDVLNAEQEFLNARTQLVTAQRNAYVAGFNLLARMGKAEARDLGLATGELTFQPAGGEERFETGILEQERQRELAVKATVNADMPPLQQ